LRLVAADLALALTLSLGSAVFLAGVFLAGVFLTATFFAVAILIPF
jgi:hypothetical protein